MPFTIDEKTIIKMYCGVSHDRDQVIASIQGSFPIVEDQEIRETMNSVIRKAGAMSSAAFAAIDLSDALDPTMSEK